MKRDMFKMVLSDKYENAWLCLDVRPAYRYEGDVKTDEVVGVYYRCLHPQAPGDGHVDIKVMGQSPVVSPEEAGLTCTVTFEELEFVMWTDRRTKASRTSGRAVRASRIRA